MVGHEVPEPALNMATVIAAFGSPKSSSAK